MKLDKLIIGSWWFVYMSWAAGFFSINMYLFLFRRLPDQTLWVSLIVLGVLLLFSLSIGIWLCTKTEQERKFLCILQQLVLPVGLYDMAANRIQLPWGPIFLIAAVLVSMWGTSTYQKKMRLRGKKKSLYMIYQYWRRNLSFTLTLFLLVLFIRNEWPDIQRAIPKNINADQMVSIDEGLIRTILTQEDSSVLTYPVKEGLIQEICIREAKELGIPHDISFRIVKIEDKNTLAYYNHNLQMITFSEEFFKNSTAKDLISCALHEMHHAYLQSLNDVYVKLSKDLSEEEKELSHFQYLERISGEFENYVSPKEGDVESQTGYYNLLVERLAREYAETKLQTYIGEKKMEE